MSDFCPHCHTSLDRKRIFCPSCGKRIDPFDVPSFEKPDPAYWDKTYEKGLRLFETGDYDQAFKLFESGAEAKNSFCLNALGVCFSKGLGTNQDYMEAMKYFAEAASMGCFHAYYNAGICYEKGLGVPQSHEEAKKWYKMAAQKGDEDAKEALAGENPQVPISKTAQEYMDKAKKGDPYYQYELGKLYQSGEGVPQDYALAVKWFLEASSNGYSDADFELGVHYQEGWGVPQNFATAAEWYRKLAEMGDDTSQNNLGSCYLQGEDGIQDFSKAFKWFKKSADQGNSRAKANLAVLYQTGSGVQKDEKEAFLLAMESAADGDGRGMGIVSYFYYHGIGTEKDAEKSKEWAEKAIERGYEPAKGFLNEIKKIEDDEKVDDADDDDIEVLAEKGNAGAQLRMGDMCFEGHNRSKDDKEALKWWEKAAKGGDVLAIEKVAFAYRLGEIVEQNDSEALRWFLLGAEAGDHRQQLAVATIYLFGSGGPKCPEEGFKWCKKSAESGNLRAQLTLGHCFETGLGTQIDKKEAKKLYKVAWEQGISYGKFKYGVLTGDEAIALDGCHEWIEGHDRDMFEIGHKLTFGPTGFVGPIFYREMGFVPNTSEVVPWLKNLAASNNPSAELELGYYFLRSVKDENEKEAFKWFQISASHGNAEAQYMVGHCYDMGIGVEEDKSQAFLCFLSSAESGCILAMGDLGDCYDEGSGTDKNETLAVQWYKKGAELGNRRCMEMLPYFYEDGIGIPKDQALADKWEKEAKKPTLVTQEKRLAKANAVFILSTDSDELKDFKSYFKAGLLLLSKCEVDYSERIYAVLYAFLFTIADKAAIDIGLDRTNLYDEMSAWFYDVYLKSRNLKVIDDVEQSFDILGGVIRGARKIRGEFIYSGETRRNINEEGPFLLKCSAVFADLIRNENAIEDYEQAPIFISGGIIESMKFYTSFFPSVQQLAQSFYVRMSKRKQDSGSTKNFSILTDFPKSLYSVQIDDFDHKLAYEFLKLSDYFFQNSDISYALDLLFESADLGNSHAQYLMGDFYRSDKHSDDNFKTAFEWYEKAAEQGHTEAMIQLSSCYISGIGTQVDKNLGVEWLKKATESGNQKTDSTLQKYLTGIEDIKESAARLLASGEREKTSSPYIVALLYEYGIGTGKNDEKAFYWFEKAASQGEIEAIGFLGKHYLYGIGVSQDVKKGIELLQKGAELGSVHAELALAHIYENGPFGIEKNIDNAVKWYRKAAERGSEDAKRALEKLDSEDSISAK